MRAYLRALLLVVGASVILGSSAPARGEEVLSYSSGAPARSGSSGRSRYTGFPRGQARYQVPAAVAGYWYGYPQQVYPVPASRPAPAAGYWYYSPQPIYQIPAAGPGMIGGYWYFYPTR